MKIDGKEVDLTKIADSEQSPTVQILLSVITQLQEQLSNQSKQAEQFHIQMLKQLEKIEELLAELKRIKKLSAKPKITASKLPKDNDDDESTGNTTETKTKRPGSNKRSKKANLRIDDEKIIAVESIPIGAIKKGYQDYIVQDLIINPIVTKYRLERWKLPDGSYITAKLPKSLQGHHFGPTLRAYVLHQHHHQCVTQPLLHKQLLEWDVDISTGQLNRILTENKEVFHQEKSSVLSAGLSVSQYIQVDDTGARHKGKNGYCTFIGNDLFSWFESTGSKSRINFLELLNSEHKSYMINDHSFAYLERHNVPPWIRDTLRHSKEKAYSDKDSWNNYLKSLNIKSKNFNRYVTESTLLGSILHHGYLSDTVILSDDAGQFNILQHALCWIHAERGIKALLPSNPKQADAIEWARNEVWEIYDALRTYKSNPNEQDKVRITKRFDKFCNMTTDYALLNSSLKRMFKNKDELLLVLKRPDIPLHNNLSERDIREYVKRRKISGSTRSDEGRRCRDTFASLKKTALKLGIGFWDYLLDRLTFRHDIKQLDQILLSLV